MDSGWKSAVTGFAKLAAISFTVAGGLRGGKRDFVNLLSSYISSSTGSHLFYSIIIFYDTGYIFPLMCTGAAFGRTLHALLPWIPLQHCVLCMAAGINVAITRTALASTLILSFLSGEACAIPAILMASLCSLFATAYLPFIKTQITRSDIDHSLFHEEHIVKEGGIIEESESSED
jgi:H+/Cl- antiporter ClcA